MTRTMYSKRAGTSGIHGQLYETKLLSLLYFRAIHDDDIEEFQLASNIDNIGAFDDICFKAKLKGFDKPVAMFIQSKHKEKDKLKIDLVTYYKSYMKIKQVFHPSNNNLFFRGIFDETECLFVIYTNAKVDLSDVTVGSDFCAKLKYLIDTGGTVKQPCKHEEALENLTKKTVRDQVTLLAERIAKIVTGKKKDFTTPYDDLVLRYHAILAQKVFDVSEIQPPLSKDAARHRMASFRKDFFDNNEEYITLFKDILYLEIIKEFDPQLLTHRQLTRNVLSQSTYYNEAVKLAVKEKILSLHFRVPATFGNKDLTINGSDVKIERRINYLASRINDLLGNCTSSKMVTIDESLGHGFLGLNGGLAGAIGNIFVLDDNTKLMKFTENWKSLGTLAKRLYAKLNSEIQNLREYKFCIRVDNFPKLSFDCSEYEEYLARNFLKKLRFYCNQADEKGVEEILKDEIARHYQHNQPQYFQVKTDAIFYKYHDAILKWWKQPEQSCSLTRESDLFLSSINNIVKDPLMSAINLTYMNKLQQYNYKFTEDAVKSLNLQEQHSNTVIVAENSVLTVVKVMQHLKDKYHVVLDLEYIVNLPTNDQNALRSELKNTNEEKVLILVCNKIDSRNEMKTLEDIAEAVRSKTTIIITNHTSLQIINRYFPKPDDILHDKKLRLIDLSKESQNSLIEAATAMFPGGDIKLELLLKGWLKTGPRSVGAAVAAYPMVVKETGTGSH